MIIYCRRYLYGEDFIGTEAVGKIFIPYLSIDHLKIGLIRSGQCRLSADSNDAELT